VDHANCLKSWIAIVKAGNLAIFTDFNLDQEQADFLKGWQPP
jgi:antirestriction protein ArdC